MDRLKNSPFFAKTVFSVHTPYNGQVFVIDQGKRRRMAVGDFNYSLYSFDPADTFSDRYWGKVGNGIVARMNNVDSALILGLGGGTIAYLLNKAYGPIAIDGVEIDPEIIAIGRKFFYLSELPNMSVFEDDALRWLEVNQGRKYSVVVTDVFKALETPKECESEPFFNNIKKVLKDNGLVVVNKVFSRKREDETVEKFELEVLRPFFSTIEAELIEGALDIDNILFYAR